MKKMLQSVVGAVALACSGAAFAQSDYGNTSSAPPPEERPAETTTVIVQPETPRPAPIPCPPLQKAHRDDKWDDMRGFSVLVGGGMEGYTGSLAPRIKAGAAWEVIAQVKPTSVLGIELAYSGAYNSFQPSRLGGAQANLVRNGGQVAITAGLSATRVQPYILLGLGVQRYSLDSTAESFGYRSVTNGYIPVGAGIRTYFAGRFTLDLRGTYNIDFGDTVFAGLNDTAVGGVGTTINSSGRWRGVLAVGYTF